MLPPTDLAGKCIYLSRWKQVRCWHRTYRPCTRMLYAHCGRCRRRRFRRKWQVALTRPRGSFGKIARPTGRYRSKKPRTRDFLNMDGKIWRSFVVNPVTSSNWNSTPGSRSTSHRCENGWSQTQLLFEPNSGVQLSRSERLLLARYASFSS